jgi:hypothetical protein
MDQVYQHLPSEDPPKYTQIFIFDLKTNHLATLVLEATVLFPERMYRVTRLVCEKVAPNVAQLIFVTNKTVEKSSPQFSELKKLPKLNNHRKRHQIGQSGNPGRNLASALIQSKVTVEK